MTTKLTQGAQAQLQPLQITEGISGLWHYHLSINTPGGFVQGLCGARTMRTSMPLGDWKVPFGQHFPKQPTFCEVCDRLKTQHTVSDPAKS